jgi:hypothetical protein
MNLATPSSVQKLQKALHDKAKESPKRRFHAPYDKVYRRDVLAFAYACCKANSGAAGVDGQSFEDIEKYGVERWLDELAEELRNRTYQPRPVRRVYIPKPDGKQRPFARAAFGGTRLLSSLAGDLCGRRMGIAIISFTKNPSEAFGALLCLRVKVALIAVRSRGGALHRKLGRPVLGAW